MCEIGPYLSRLCETLVASMTDDSRPISLKVQAEDGTAYSTVGIWRSADVEGDPAARAARFGIVRSAAAASTRGSRATLLMANRQLID